MALTSILINPHLLANFIVEIVYKKWFYSSEIVQIKVVLDFPFKLYYNNFVKLVYLNHICYFFYEIYRKTFDKNDRDLFIYMA